MFFYFEIFIIKTIEYLIHLWYIINIRDDKMKKNKQIDIKDIENKLNEYKNKGASFIKFDKKNKKSIFEIITILIIAIIFCLLVVYMFFTRKYITN